MLLGRWNTVQRLYVRDPKLLRVCGLNNAVMTLLLLQRRLPLLRRSLLLLKRPC